MQEKEILALVSAGSSKTSLPLDLGDTTEYSIQANFLGHDTNTLTFPAKVGATAGDYVVITDGNGLTWAAALNVTGTDPAPTGAAYTAVAAARKVNVNISATTTAATVAAAVKAALNALTGFTSVITADDSAADGTMILTQLVVGSVASPVPHNENDTGAGSISVGADASSVVGSLKLEASNDATYWATVTNSTQAVSQTSFPYSHMWSGGAEGYRYVRGVWTYTSGLASVEMKAFIKQPVVR